jgi:hypothetical protein
MNHTSNIREDVILASSPVIGAGAHCSGSAVAWQSILAGAFAATALSVILLFLGSGLGLATMSPWDHADFTVMEFSVTAAIWLIVMQWVSSAMGGYLSGRLRTKWTGLHTDEVLFRDTAHGFMAWAVATVITVAVLTSAMSSIVGGGAKIATAAAATAAASEESTVSTDPVSYYIDNLYRTSKPATSADNRAETFRIVAKGVKNGSFSDADKSYMADLIVARTGVTRSEATTRVDAMETDIEAAKATAEKARKSGATFALLTFLSLIIGAFIASVAGAIGGRHRDLY